jgi:hypothetical protein
MLTKTLSRSFHMLQKKFKTLTGGSIVHKKKKLTTTKGCLKIINLTNNSLIPRPYKVKS